MKVLDLSYGQGAGNTAMIYHHGKLLALSEFDKPCEMFTFGYSQTPPYITYRVFSKDGFMNDPVLITIADPIMMHDFAITENSAIIMDLPLYFRPRVSVLLLILCPRCKLNMNTWKLIFQFDVTKNARFGVLPRYAKNELLIKWLELPNCFIFHNANAWEEGDEVVLITCRSQNPDLDMMAGSTKEKIENFTYELYEMRFNMKTALAWQKKLSASAVDFPRINENYTGRKQRYVYGAIMDSIVKVTAIVKLDLHAEPDIRKTKLEVGGNVHEDDGYLIHFVHDENTSKSSVNVIDAKTMSADPVAVVELPNRVPYGLHALFVTEEQLQEQAKL
ncbi:Carotenoid cleavage dioxygenase 1 [Heracleum sosnowskyi]|uniref:carotenoid 9,10-dioxygenase n=1 Tax=Heracleum sosnowskyi TaxID=360622 RepID=A0AAD8H1A8_9APIA|nr:Carotenoid cleavage dioxygenase 1 [Heracleum sosnowskyi]